MKVGCSTDLGLRKCGKFLGEFDILIGWLYCKSCKQKNYYEVTTEAGIKKTRQL